MAFYTWAKHVVGHAGGTRGHELFSAVQLVLLIFSLFMFDSFCFSLVDTNFLLSRSYSGVDPRGVGVGALSSWVRPCCYSINIAHIFTSRSKF